MLTPLAPRLLIPEDALVLITLSDTPSGASQLLRTLGKHLLSPLLPLRRSVLVPEHLLPLGSLQASFLTELPLSSFLLLPLPLLLKREC